MTILVKRAGHLAMARHLDAEQSPHIHVGGDRQQRVIAAMLGSPRPPPRGRRRRIGQRPDESAASTRRPASRRIASTRVGGSCLCESVDGTRRIRAASADAGSAPSACARRRFARSTLVAPEWLGQRPVGVAVRAGARGDHDRRRRLEVAQRGDGVLAVAVGPQHEGAVDGVAAAVPARAWRAADVDVGTPAQHDRARRQSTRTVGAVEDLPHPLTVVEAVAQLEQLAAARPMPASAREEVRATLFRSSCSATTGPRAACRRRRPHAARCTPTTRCDPRACGRAP